MLTEQASKDFAHLIAGFMQQMFPRLPELGLDALMLSNGLVGANTRIATQWVADRCKPPLEDVLRNLLSLFQACILYARAQLEELDRTPKAPRKTA